MKKVIAIACATLAFAIAFVSGWVLLRQYCDAKSSSNSFEELAEMIVDVTIPPVSSEEAPEAGTETVETEEAAEAEGETAETEADIQAQREAELARQEAELAQTKYGALYSKNQDFVGWIFIDGTDVDYPVMQTLNEPNYYLKRNFKKHHSDYGVPYVDAACELGVSNNIVIYGHNMNDGSMFADICKYKRESFYEEHKIICFDTLSTIDEYEVVAVFKYNASNETFKFNTYTTMNEAEFAEFMENVRARQLYDTGVEVEYGDKLLTLSTCEYSYKNGRFVVVAKKIS